MPLLDLPHDALLQILRHLRLSELQSASSACTTLLAAASADELWIALFRERRWTSTVTPAAGEWRAAYREHARAESPLIVHRRAWGFARDAKPQLGPPRYPAAEFSAVLVVDPLDAPAEVEEGLRRLYAAGATRTLVADASVCSLNSLGLASGLALFVERDGVTAAAVLDGERLAPPPRRAQRTHVGYGHALDVLAAAHERVDAARPADDELAALMRQHCLRAVSVARKPVSASPRTRRRSRALRSGCPAAASSTSARRSGFSPSSASLPLRTAAARAAAALARRARACSSC